MTITKYDIEEREKLMKVKLSDEIKQSANIIMARHLRDNNSSAEVTDTAYAVARVVEINLEIKRPLRKEKKKKENRRVRKMEKHTGKLRQLVRRARNEI